jgi:hypothetical protein
LILVDTIAMSPEQYRMPDFGEALPPTERHQRVANRALHGFCF